jgi:peptide/nickel transport system substrate-binding protein
MVVIPLSVRQAVAEAWPLKAENEAAGLIPGLTLRPATTIVASVTPGWLAHDAIGNEGKGNGDPSAARRMLKDADKLGFELSFTFAFDDDAEAATAEVRRKALTEAGFTVKAGPVPSALAHDLADNGIRPVNLRTGRWCTDWASGDSVLPAVLDGRKAHLPGAPIQSFLNVDRSTPRSTGSADFRLTRRWPSGDASTRGSWTSTSPSCLWARKGRPCCTARRSRTSSSTP